MQIFWEDFSKKLRKNACALAYMKKKLYVGTPQRVPSESTVASCSPYANRGIFCYPHRYALLMIIECLRPSVYRCPRYTRIGSMYSIKNILLRFGSAKA